MTDDAGVPPEYLEWHGHNDFYKGFINATTAWLYGCAAANGTLLGFGERTGNPPVEALIIEYISLVGDNNGIDTKMITEIRNYLERDLGVVIPVNMPFVGGNFNSTSAGIHADGILKNEEVYNIFDTDKVLNRPISISINDKSGLAGIAQWINSHFALTGNLKVKKVHPSLVKINQWINEQYKKGRTTNISDHEMAGVTRKYLPDIFVSEFDRLKRKAQEMAFHLIEEVIENLENKVMDIPCTEEILQSLIDNYQFIQFAYVVDQRGIQLTKSICQTIDRAKYAHVGVGENYANRQWFIEPLKDGEIHVSDFYTSRITNALCITVSGPIRSISGHIEGVLGIDLRIEELMKSDSEVL